MKLKWQQRLNWRNLSGKYKGLALLCAVGTGLFAESVMILQGFQSPRAKGHWSVDSVTLSGTRTSYTIQVEATRPI